MIEHAFRYVERIVFVVAEMNARSRRALEKIGAHLDRREERIPGRAPIPFLVYAMTRPKQIV